MKDALLRCACFFAWILAILRWSVEPTVAICLGILLASTCGMSVEPELFWVVLLAYGAGIAALAFICSFGNKERMPERINQAFICLRNQNWLPMIRILYVRWRQETSK